MAASPSQFAADIEDPEAFTPTQQGPPGPGFTDLPPAPPPSFAGLGGPSTPVADEANPVFAADRVAIEAAIRTSLWGSSDIGSDLFADRALRPIVDYVDQLTRDDPALRRLVTEDVEAFALLSDEQALDRVRNGGVTGLDDFMAAVADTAWEAGATEVFVRLAKERDKANESLFTNLTLKFTPGSLETDTPELAGENKLGVSLENATGWALDATGNLAISFGRRSFAGRNTALSDQPLTVIARVDPNARIETQLDLLGEIRKAAVAGNLRVANGDLASQAEAEEATGMLAVMGENVRGTPFEPVIEGVAQGLRAIVGTLNPVQGVRDVFDQTPIIDQIAQGKTISQMAAVDAQLSAIRHPEAFLVAALASNLAAEARAAGQDVTASQAMSIVRGSMSDVELDGMAEDFLSMTRSEFLAKVEETAGEVTPGEVLFGAASDAFDPVMKTLEVWSDIARQTGVQLYDYTWDLNNGWVQVLTGDLDEGFQHFQNAFTDPADFNLSPAQWFAKKGFVQEYNEDGTFIDQTSIGQALNLFTEFWADPTNLLGIGVAGGTARRLSRAAITDARYADVATKLPAMSRIVDDIASDDPVRAVMSAFDLQGADAGVGKLLEVALNPASTRAEVEAAVQSILPSMPGEGNFLGMGGFTRARSNSIGAARQFDMIANMNIPLISKALNTKTGKRLIDWFTVAKTERHISTLDPYEGLKTMIATLFHSDNPALLDNARELMGIANKGGHLSDARVGELAARLEDLKRQAKTLEGELAVAGPTPADLQVSLDSTQKLLAETPVGTPLYDDLVSQVQSVSQTLDAGTPHGELRRQASALDRQIQSIRKLTRKDTLGDTHEAMSDFAYRLLDQEAENINAIHRANGGTEDLVPVITRDGAERMNLLAPGWRARDWSRVTGDAKPLDMSDPETLSRVAGFVDDPDMAALASGLGMFNSMSQIPLPISANEILAARAFAKNPAAMAKFNARATVVLARRASKFWRSIWSFLVLMNPETSIRTSLDEALWRMPLVTGDIAGTGKAIYASLPGIGRFQPGFDSAGKFGVSSERWVTNSYVKAGARGSGGGGGAGSWETISQATPEWRMKGGKWTAEGRQHVERFVNGGFLSDDVFKNFARGLDDEGIQWVDDVASPGGRRPITAPQSFVDWWEKNGINNIRSTSVTLGEGMKRSIKTADDAYRAMWDVWNHWLDTQVNASARGVVSRRMLDGATGKQPLLHVDDDARILNAITRVQAEIPNETTTMIGNLWDFGYANPSSRRQGVIMQRLYDEKLAMLQDAHSAKNGKYVLTPEALVERYAMDPDEAAWAVRQGSEHPRVRALMADQGVTTQANLERIAYNSARREAMDMMYQLSATTRAGQAVDNPLLAPFLRAQTDFIGWWWDYQSRPLQLRMGVHTRQALAEHPLLAGAAGKIEGAPAPVNFAFRTMRELAHVNGAFGGTSGDDNTQLERFIDRVTFLPGPWSDDWLTKTAPAPGLAPGWLLDQLLDDENVGQAFVESLWPQIGWNQSASLTDLAFPNPTRGIRNMGVSGIRGLSAMLGMPPGTEAAPELLSWTVNVLEGSRDPVGTTDYENMLWAKWLRENGNQHPPGSDAYNEARSAVAVEARSQAYIRGAGIDAAAYAFPFYYSVLNPDLYASDRLSLESWSALVEDKEFVDGLMLMDGQLKEAGGQGFFEANLLFDDETGKPAASFEQSRLARSWERWRSGEATREDRQFLGDSLADMFFNRLDDVEVWEGSGFTYQDYMVVVHPEAGMSLVSSLAPASDRPTSAAGRRFWEGEYDPETGDEISPPFVSGEGTNARIINIPPGPAGQQIRSDALNAGWLVERPFEDRAADASNAYRRARSKIISYMWTLQTGRDWASDSATQTRDGQITSGLKKSMQDASFTVSSGVKFWADKLGVDLPGENMTFQDFRELLETWKIQSTPEAYAFTEVLSTPPGQRLLEDPEFGAPMYETFRQTAKVLAAREPPILSFGDWPDETKAAARDQLSEAFNQKLFTRAEYDRFWRDTFGELDFKPPTPPPVAELALAMDASPDQITVVDGDTVNVMLEDGSVPVRLIGLLTPDQHQPGFDESADNLQRLLDNAESVTFGIYNPETFGTTQLQGPNSKRALMWLYVDGVPIWDATIFTPESPTGSQGEPRVTNLEAILSAGSADQRLHGR